MIRALDDYERHVHGAAVSSLARLGTRQAEGTLIDLVDRNKFRARLDIDAWTAIRKLGSMGMALTTPMLRLAMEQGPLEWAAVAARALRQLGDTITAVNRLARLSSPYSRRRRAVLALPALVDQDALPHLQSGLGDGDAAVRAAGARELGHLDDAERHPRPHRRPGGRR